MCVKTSYNWSVCHLWDFNGKVDFNLRDYLLIRLFVSFEGNSYVFETNRLLHLTVAEPFLVRCFYLTGGIFNKSGSSEVGSCKVVWFFLGVRLDSFKSVMPTLRLGLSLRLLFGRELLCYKFTSFICIKLILFMKLDTWGC